MKKIANKRIDWLDTLRGLAMFFVIWGHAFPTNKGLVRKIIYSFHMPIFFLISGITFKEDDLSTKEFITKKIKNLVVPYFIINIISYILFFILFKLGIIDNFDPLNWFFGIFYAHDEVFTIPCGPSWFLLVLFLVEVLFYYFKKIFDNDGILGIAISVCGLISYVNSLSEYQVYTPWHLEAVLTGIVFYYIGYLISKNINVFDMLLKNKFKSFCLGLLLGVIGVICAYFNRRVSMHANLYGSITLFYIGSLAIIFGLIIFVRLFMKKSLFFKNIGKRTLFYLAYHFPFVYIIKHFIENAQKGNINILITAICISIIFYPFAFLSYKYAPILCGKIKS